MDLTVLDRILLFGVLPNEGDILTLKTLRVLREDLSFSDEEKDQFDIVSTAEKITWNEQKAEGHVKRVTITPKMQVTIAERLKQMSAQGKLQDLHVDLYDKFVTD